MPLKLLQHKSWHVYSAENVARVQRDEAAAQAASEESDRRMMLADSEARLDRMRKKSRKRDRGKEEGEDELERQLRGEKRREVEPPEESGTRIVRPEKGKEKAVDPVGHTNGHLNFWAELEAGGKAPSNLESKLEKALEKEKEESFTKVYLAKRGEGDIKGWYASEDGKTERERKEGVEATLERAYKDGEHKRLSDPLSTMNAYLKRRSDILAGHIPCSSTSSNRRERYITPATPASERGDLSPVITSLLAPRRRRGDPIPPPPEPVTRQSPQRPSSTVDPAREAQSRVSSERARAAALIAAKRREALASSAGTSVASDTPRSEFGSGMFNAEATREARERRGGWGEQKRRRDERDRWGAGDRGWSARRG